MNPVHTFPSYFPKIKESSSDYSPLEPMVHPTTQASSFRL
jgi:hypothetical protein